MLSKTHITNRYVSISLTSRVCVLESVWFARKELHLYQASRLIKKDCPSPPPCNEMIPDYNIMIHRQNLTKVVIFYTLGGPFTIY